MSESEKWRRIGEDIGRALAEGIEAVAKPLADAVREHYAALYGRCRRCDAPLGGPSPEKVCEPCHAAEVLEAANGKPPEGEA